MPAQPLARFAEVVDPAADEAWRAEIRSTVEALRGRVVWHVSSTARGGGVAEMMGPLIGYARDAGADSRWMVIAGPPEFFASRSGFTTGSTPTRATEGLSGRPSAGSTSACSARTRPSWPPSCAAATWSCCTTRRRRASRRR